MTNARQAAHAVDADIIVDPDPGAAAAFLQRRIVENNYAITGVRDGSPFALTIQADGEIVAGACGFTWARVCVLDVLWVADGRRDAGVGSRLLAAVENLAVTRDCIQVVTSTHAFQAPRFYLARGYEVCGVVDDYPPGSAHLHLAKKLRGTAQTPTGRTAVTT